MNDTIIEREEDPIARICLTWHSRRGILREKICSKKTCCGIAEVINTLVVLNRGIRSSLKDGKAFPQTFLGPLDLGFSFPGA